jgi:hypothetical protein
MKLTPRLRTAAAAALALAGGVALTACGSSDGTDAAAAAPAAVHASPSPSAAAHTGSAGTKAAGTNARPASRSDGHAQEAAGTTGTARSGGTSTSGSTTTGAGHPSHAGGTSGSTAQGLDAPCTTAGTRLAVQKVAEPINHLLLTVTNTGSTRCAAIGAPDLGFDGDQAVTRILRDSVPQAVVELEPGDSAYAAIGLSAGDGSGAHGRTVTSLRVQFQDRNLAPTGSQRTIAPPSGTYKDDSAFVTYWQTEPSAALTY